MRKISFAEKNSLVIRHKNKKFFFKDLELFNKHFPSHTLINELARANEFSYDRLDGQMLYELLSVVEMKEILENRTEKEQEELPEPTEVKTLDDVKTLLIEQLGLTEEDIEQIGEDYLQFLTPKDEEEIIAAVKKLIALRSINDNEEGTGNDTLNDDTGSYIPGEGSDQDEKKDGLTETPSGDSLQEVQRDNVKVFQQRIANAKTIGVVEAILKEDREGGERVTVQRAGQTRIDALKTLPEETDDKKKD